MPAAPYVRHSGVWKVPDKIYVRNANVWKEPTGVFVKVAGVWQRVWPVGPASKLVASYSPPGTKNNFSGEVGHSFMLSADRAVSWIGCKVVAGNTGTHTVKLYDGLDNVLRTATFDMSNPLVVNTYAWAQISPITLLATTQYFLVKTVTSGGQFWWDDGPTTFNLATIFRSSVNRVTGGSVSNVTTDNQFAGLDLGW